MKKVFLFFIFLFFISCSQKKYFEPKDVSWSSSGAKKYYISGYITDINSIGATTNESKTIDKNGISKNKIKKGFLFLNNIDGKIISSNEYDSVFISGKGEIKLNSSIVAASLKDNLLALVFSNNTIALYDLDKKEYRIKKYLKPSVLNDTRIANPLFLNSVVLFPTLDGEVIVLDIKGLTTNKIPIDLENDINNIILLKNFNDTLIVATSNKIFSLKDGKVSKKSFFIQSYNFDDRYIYIATLDGRVLKLNDNLDILKEQKFKFAKFSAIAVTKKYIYLIEQQGYIIKIDKEFKKYLIFSDTFENDEKTIGLGNKIYNGDRVFIFKD